MHFEDVAAGRTGFDQMDIAVSGLRRLCEN